MNRGAPLAAVITYAMLLSVPASGQIVRMSTIKGTDLAEMCRKEIAPNQLDPCNSFIIAATDAYQSSEETCLSAPGAYVPVAIGVVRKYLRDHPEKLGWPAALLVRASLQESFPCKALRKK